MTISRRKTRGHGCLGWAFTSIVTILHRPCIQPLITLINWSQQPHTAPRATNQTARHTREPNPGTPTTGHPAPTPRPPCSDHHTQEHAAVNKAPGGTTVAPAAQRAHHSYMPSNASLNSVTARPSLRESHHYHHTRALPALEDPDENKLNPTGPSCALTAYTSFIFLCTGRVSEQPGLARPPAPQDPDPTSCTQRHRAAGTPTMCLAHHP